MASTTLASRSAVAAADSNPVEGTAYRIPATPVAFDFRYTTTGSPTSTDIRCAIEASVDGTNWIQVVRFIDQTDNSGASRRALLPGTAAAAEGSAAASALGSAAASATLVDLPAGYYRAVTKVQTLSGGSSPTVTLTVTASTPT